MKFLLFSAACVCLFALLNAAAVQPVEPVEPAVETQTQTQSTESTADTAINCHQPKEVGRCFALFYRYAYNVESGQCEEFIFGGCGGNSNNFETKEACEAKCLNADNASSTVVPQQDAAATTAATPAQEDHTAVVTVDGVQQ